MTSSFKSRIAPTPSGFLHQGNLLNFLLIQSLKEKAGATIHLRIDDGDQARARDEYIEDIFRTLEWLKIDIDSGPSDVEDFKRNFSQRTREDLYQKALDQLRIEGADIYACQCSRKEILAQNNNALYGGACRHLKLLYQLGEHALRVNTTKADSELQESLGDFVLWKKDGGAAYQLSSLVDDLYYDINFIIRGEDLYPSTLAQKYLKSFLAPNKSIHFYHHPLLTINGEKISKSQGQKGWSKIYNEKRTINELKSELNFSESERTLEKFIQNL